MYVARDVCMLASMRSACGVRPFTISNFVSDVNAVMDFISLHRSESVGFFVRFLDKWLLQLLRNCVTVEKKICKKNHSSCGVCMD